MVYCNRNLKKAKYFKLEVVGRYCYYNIINDQVRTTVTRGEYGLGVKTGYTNSLMIIDMNNGSRGVASDVSIRRILSDDDELLKLFESDQSRNENFKSYLEKYNKKHKRDIKR